MMYSSGMWSLGRRSRRRPRLGEPAKDRLLRRLAGAAPGAAVLDVGCGWGGTLRRLVEHRCGGHAVGLTLSPAQRDFVRTHPFAGADVRLEDWNDHDADGPYDAILSFGAFEHFAKDGTTRMQRIDTYRRFFARCFEWLKPDGRLGLETIAHDDAPDTASPLGRGPLGDVVLQLYPESLCPHLCGARPRLRAVLRGGSPPVGRRGFRQDVPALAPRAARARSGGRARRRGRRHAASGAISRRRKSSFVPVAVTNYRWCCSAVRLCAGSGDTWSVSIALRRPMADHEDERGFPG